MKPFLKIREDLPKKTGRQGSLIRNRISLFFLDYSTIFPIYRAGKPSHTFVECGK
jgi:hypothetical protein